MAKVSDQSLYKKVFHLAWPAVLEAFFINLAGLIDTMMVAGLGAAAVAATGLSTQPFFLTMTPVIATTVSLSALVARRMGEERREKANETFVTACLICFILAFFVTAFGLLLADPVLRIAGSNPQTHEMGVAYYHARSLGIFVLVFTMAFDAAQRGSGNTHIAFKVNLTSSAVNIFLNYLLIYGHWGFPKLGVYGAGLATVLGDVVACILATISVFGRHSYIKIPYIVKHQIRASWASFKSILYLGLPLAAENVLMRVGFVATAVTAAGLGTEPFAAHQVTMNLLGLGFSFGDGMQTSAMTLTGNALGAKEGERAIRYGRTCRTIGYFLAGFLSLAVLLFGPQFYDYQFADAQVVNMGVHISRYIILIVFFQIQQLIYNGVLRSAGDVKYTMITSMISVTIIRTLATLLFVHFFHLGLDGIWMGILLDQFFRFLFSYWRFHQGKWIYLKI